MLSLHKPTTRTHFAHRAFHCTGPSVWNSLNSYIIDSGSLVVFTARRSYASAVLGVVILSVCLSVTRVLCDKTKVGVFKECVTLSANFRRKGYRPPTTVGVRNLEFLSCGIKISAVRCLVLSQSTRVTDRQTDRITTANAALA